MFKPAPSDKTMPVIGVALDAEDLAMLKEVGLRRGWKVESADAIPGNAWRHGEAVILCSRTASNLGWRDAIAKLSAGAPRGCTFLVSRVNDGYLEQEVFLFGGSAVLISPLRQEPLIRAVEAAWTFKR